MGWLRRFAQFAWLAILLSAAALAAPNAARVLLPLSVLLFAGAPLLLPAPPCWRALTRISLLVFLFAAGFTVFYQPGRPIDLFEDGQLLASAQAYGAGGRPYIDTYPLHGWGADGGFDAILFRVFGRNLEVFWLRRAVMTALALAVLGWCSFQVFKGAGWAAVALLCSLGICPFLSERHLPAFVALGLVARAAGSARSRDWLLAGIASSATLFCTLDFGLIALGGGIAIALALAPDRSSHPWKPGTRSAFLFLYGAAAGGLPFLLWLFRQGALAAFFRVSFLEIPTTITETWGLPGGSVSGLLQTSPTRFLFLLLLGDGMPALFLLTVLGSAMTLVLFRVSEGTIEPVDRAAAASIVFGCLALRGALGRADAGHLALYGVFAGPAAAWILYRASRARRSAGLLTAATALVFATRLNLHGIIGLEAGAVAGASRAREATAASETPGGGGPPELRSQGSEIAVLRRSFDAGLKPGETFFDFANEPALYFLLGRTPPVRYSCVPLYEVEPKQREVVEALERFRPPLAILAGGSGRDAFDGVPNRERAPLVAAYLDARYEPIGKVGGRTIARRKIN